VKGYRDMQRDGDKKNREKVRAYNIYGSERPHCKRNRSLKKVRGEKEKGDCANQPRGVGRKKPKYDQSGREKGGTKRGNRKGSKKKKKQGELSREGVEKNTKERNALSGTAIMGNAAKDTGEKGAGKKKEAKKKGGGPDGLNGKLLDVRGSDARENIRKKVFSGR